MLFSEPKIPQSSPRRSPAWREDLFQCSSASRKFLNPECRKRACIADAVSVLFSEPKIPQSVSAFGAVERDKEFQCSSASRKFLNTPVRYTRRAAARFQCSSASRKFLNHVDNALRKLLPRCFSALQRAENSSIRRSGACCAAHAAVSVLFSEPKIPQSRLSCTSPFGRASCFSALQRAENSSIKIVARTVYPTFAVSVLFSEPKIPQSYTLTLGTFTGIRFQCSSASRKFLNRPAPRAQPACG